MTQDQYAATDPTTLYPSTLGGRTVPYPGLTDSLDARPDHGETTYRGSGRLAGRRSLITGGDSGIGRAVAVAFAREGADVAISFLPEESEDAAATADLVATAGRTCLAMPGDVRDEEHCRTLVKETVDEFGGLDVLVVNAAFQMAVEGIETLTTDQLERTYRTNVFSLYWLVQAALPVLPAGASIITTSSIQAYQPSPALTDYAGTKAAIVNITKNLAQELAPRGIRVNSVAPGPVWTPLIPATMTEEKVSSFGQDTPEGRPAQPAEVAPAFVFLASQESSFITGAVLPVTGGELIP